MKPKFEPTDDGLEIIDPIERHRYRLKTHKAVDPEPIDPAQMQFPVSTAVRITTEMITLPTNESVYVRDGDGLMITEVRPAEQESFSRNDYILDVSSSMKVYIHINSSVDIYSGPERTYLSFSGITRTTMGARSFHTRPAETVTTSSDPEDLMQAVTTFGSSLKTTSPERSYPTLRGHPPNIELGDEIEIPEIINSPQTGIQLRIPPTLRHIITSSPLAYYLGAEVVSGSKPRIVTDSGFKFSLTDKGSFEKSIARTLKHIFFLDCVIRNEGPTRLPLHERKEIEPKLDWDSSKVYDKSLREQVERYLEIPYEKTEPYLPEQDFKLKLTPNEEVLESLPFLINNLPVIEVKEVENDQKPSFQSEKSAIEDFIRRKQTVELRSPQDGSSKCESSSGIPVTTIEQTLDGITSEVVSTTPLSAYHNSIGREPQEGAISIKVVCNDQDMHEELKVVNKVYGTREELPFDLTQYYDLNKDELKSILASECDFLHYIGHIDDSGFQCSDGKLDATSISSVGMKAFLLNACQSYEQGVQLINAGSSGGIVTLDDVINSGAISVGSTIARLLDRGYPLYAALDIARKRSIVGEQYRIVGDGITTIAQSETGNPSVCLLDQSNDEIKLKVKTYFTSKNRQGAVFTPYIGSLDKYYLAGNTTEEISATKSQIKEYLQLEQVPVITNGDVQWSKKMVDEI